MIETYRLKNVVIFIPTVLSFVLSRKIINIYNDTAQKYENVTVQGFQKYEKLEHKKNKFYNDIARKYGNVTVKDLRKYEQLEYKKNKLKLDIDCKQLGVYLKFLIFKLPNISNRDALFIRKRLLRSTINNHNKELQHFSKELSLLKNILPKQLSTIDF